VAGAFSLGFQKEVLKRRGGEKEPGKTRRKRNWEMGADSIQELNIRSRGAKQKKWKKSKNQSGLLLNAEAGIQK